MPCVLVFTAHPALEVPFASVWPMFRAGAVRVRVVGGGGGVGCMEIRKRRGQRHFCCIAASAGSVSGNKNLISTKIQPRFD